MLTISPIRSAEAAGHYFSKADDYYKSDSAAPSSWDGELARELGLAGREVDAYQFRSALEGRISDQHGVIQGDMSANHGSGSGHRPGWDLTFSAPKSVSVMMLAGGDERLLAAHERAVSAALRHIEQHAATARNKALEQAGKGGEATENLLVARFRHDANRMREPQLHTHAVVMNCTRDAEGRIRAIESKPILRLQKEAGELYRQELAKSCRELGYKVEVTKTEKHGFNFELTDVPRELTEKFSSRSSQVEAYLLKEYGVTRDKATAAQKDVAVLATRPVKDTSNREEMLAQWRSDGKAAGLEVVVDRARSAESQGHGMGAARDAVRQAAASLVEREARFSETALEREARAFALGNASVQEIRLAIREAENSGELVARQCLAFDLRSGQKQEASGWTTREAIQTEQSMLSAAAALSSTTRVPPPPPAGDSALASAALEMYQKHGRQDLARLQRHAERIFDSQGRVYYRDSWGNTHSAALSKPDRRSLESRNVGHLLLTKSRYTVVDKKFLGIRVGTQVMKSGGTIKTEAAQWLRDKLRDSLRDKGLAAKVLAWPLDRTLRKAEAWKKAGTLEALAVRAKLGLDNRAARREALADLRHVAAGKSHEAVRHERGAIATLDKAEAAIARQEKTTGFRFNEAQAAATRGILTDKSNLHLIQGYAGTAKTTSVLAATADELRRQGYEIKALAPTHSAKDTLQEAIKAESAQTVAAHLLERERSAAPLKAWIVDEASMLSAKDMAALLQRARTENAIVILVGDTKQLGSSEAGAPFRQLQEVGVVKTHVLDNIVRQEDQQLRHAVYDSIRGDAKAALEKVEQGGGKIEELQTREERVAAIARDYTSLSQKERDKTHKTLVITPGRDDRAEVNTAIRDRLKEAGELKGEEVTIRTLEPREMTSAQSRLAANYQPGDVLEAGRVYRDLKIGQGQQVVIEKIDAERNIITARTADGRQIEINPRQQTSFQAFSPTETKVMIGDKLRLAADATAGTGRLQEDKADRWKNGDKAIVVGVRDGKVEILHEKLGRQVLDADRAQKIVHGYAMTAHEAQGKTCARVLIHGESNRMNLQTQQNLYVSISRAKEGATIYTDSKASLVTQIERATGQKDTAMESDKSKATDLAKTGKTGEPTRTVDGSTPRQNRESWLPKTDRAGDPEQDRRPERAEDRIPDSRNRESERERGMGRGM